VEEGNAKGGGRGGVNNHRKRKKLERSKETPMDGFQMGKWGKTSMLTTEGIFVASWGKQKNREGTIVGGHDWYGDRKQGGGG